ncbi:hypothetical protein CYLTODRAFT_455276 [Cylindrobasidium torrendii FP15055 ss-10]|uniref:G-protein coupled receptors family 1 profile domain-containing protein n=1 Tax=Cylindrobasidium torrendii FP15055 ss-10 TaxID=1314674 RepID=A0A0D7B8M9_9AGAR|nr:hypothetical protein CYLTODRAFT_455276 [Cylindrobasidium torrendii FP15055 ss-10]
MSDSQSPPAGPQLEVAVVHPVFPIDDKAFPGLLVVNIVALLSTAALLSIVARVVWLACLRLYNRNITKTREYVFFQTQLGYYAACLLMANMSTSTAGLMGLPFLAQRAVVENSLCQAQAMLMQFGNAATAFFTVTIAVHTFTSLVLRRRQSPMVYSIVISFGWVFSAFFAALPLLFAQPRGPIYGQYQQSCGVRPPYPTLQFLLHILPVLIAAFGSATLYSLIFLVLRGTLVVKGGVKLALNPAERQIQSDDKDETYRIFITGVARSMLWFPIAYITLLVPYSVTKLLILAGFRVSLGALIFAYICWYILGVVNVLLMYNTFRVLRPAFDTKAIIDKADEGSFGTIEKLRPLALPEKYPVGRTITSGDWASHVPDHFNSQRKTEDEESAYGMPYGFRSGSPEEATNFGNLVVANVASPPTSLTRLGSQRSVTVPHARRDDPLPSLPVPPRRARSPPSSHGPSRNLTAQRNGSVSSMSTTDSDRAHLAPPPRPSRENPRNTTSINSTDLLNWISQQAPDGSMPSTVHSGARLSAVGPTVPRGVALNSRPRANSPPSVYSNHYRTHSPGSSSGGSSGGRSSYSSVSQYASQGGPHIPPKLGLPPRGVMGPPRNGSF